MTEKDKLEKVKAEIERLIDRKDPNTYLGVLKIEAYKDVLSFIDSMQEECNITGIKSKHATGKLKECIDNITEESLAKARKQLQEEPKECMYSKDDYTDEDRKALCEDCEEKCKFNKKEDPVSEDLEKELSRLLKDCEIDSEYIHQDFLHIVANHFSDWQKERMMKNIWKPADGDDLKDETNDM